MSSGGAKSRRKGAVFERQVVNWLRDHVWPDAERRGAGFEAADVINTGDYIIECKSQERIDLPGWWRQAERQAGEQTPLLIIKKKGVADTGECYAVLRLDDLLPLLLEMETQP